MRNQTTSEKSNNESQRFTNYSTSFPFYILFDLDLNANHLRLYGQIEQMESNPNPYVVPTFSYSWLAKELNIARRNAIECANTLKKKGYIERIRSESGHWIWRIVRKKVVEVTSSTKKDDALVTPSVTPLVTPSVTPLVTPSVTLSIYKNKDLKDNINTLVRFDEFWDIYPIKSAKKTCMEIWKRNRCDKIADEIIERLKLQKTQDKKWINGFVPNPSTYLRGERWNDEISKGIFNSKNSYNHDDMSWADGIEKDIF